MIAHYQDYTIEIINDPNYILNSVDNIVSYDIEYFRGKINTDRVYPTSKHGIRISRDGKESASAIICEIGGATTIHKNSFIVIEDSILICCCDHIYSLGLLELQLNWKKRFDPATCFGIYPFKNDLIIHGEFQITRIDRDGNEKWVFGARDIFVTPDGKESIQFIGDRIKLVDWEGHKYLLNEDGHEVK